MIVAFAVGALSTVPFEGIAGLVIPPFGIVGVLLAVRQLEKGRHPALWSPVALVVTALPLSVGIAVNGGIRSASCPLLAIVTVAAFSRTRGDRRAQVAVLSVTIGLFVAALVVGDPGALAARPDRAIVIIAVTVGLAMWGGSFVQIERAQRINALVDTLTGLPNRLALEQRAAIAWRQAELMQRSLALLAIDIDHFKQINDTHGHPRGDAVLRGVAERLNVELRSHDAAYRVGGEEFLVVLLDATEQGACELAERLRQSIENERPGLLHVTVSVGVWSGSYETSIKDATVKADEALYNAKRSGRNQVSVREGPSAAVELLAPHLVGRF